jgi:hypothetical protein
MDTEPSPVLQPSDEEIRVLQRLERRGCVGASEDAVEELGGEVAEDGRTQQKPARLVVERAEDLVVQVVGDESVISAEVAHGLMPVHDVAQPEGREVESSRPPFRPLVECLDLVRCKVEALSFDEELGRLLPCEGERAGPHLGEGAVRAEP